MKTNKTPFQLLRAKYPEEECVLIREVPDSSYRNRYLDYMVINLWASRGQSIIGFEVKSYRSDWLNELKNPKKQELHVPYCDYFYLLITEENVAKLEEVPENWGLMVVRGDKLHTIKRAPKLTPLPMPKGLMISIIRRAAAKDGYVLKEDIQSKIDDAVTMAESRFRDENTRNAQQYFNLKRTVDKFESESGTNFITRGFWGHDVINSAHKFKFILENDFDELLSRLKRINNTATALAETSKQGLEIFSEENKKENNNNGNI